ncbi:MAG TPA: hypothetical protein VIT67_15005 [Povalibacter sp.]
MSMRSLFALPLVCLCGFTAFAAAPITPRQYLDEETTATITVVAEPIAFVAIKPADPARWSRDRELQKKKDKNQDIVELYGLDVNRMGSHRQYIAVTKWLVPKQSVDAQPILVLKMGATSLELKEPERDARKLGMAQPLAPAFASTSQWWYFPADVATLKSIAAAPELSATLTLGDIQTPYKLARDGRPQLTALTAVLPQ